MEMKNWQYLEKYQFAKKTIINKLTLDLDAEEEKILNFGDCNLEILIFVAFRNFISIEILEHLVSTTVELSWDFLNKKFDSN